MEPDTQATHPVYDPPAYGMIAEDLKVAWKYAVRAMNAAQNSGCDNLATYYRIVAEISAELEFCEAMAQTLTTEGDRHE